MKPSKKRNAQITGQHPAPSANAEEKAPEPQRDTEISAEIVPTKPEKTPRRYCRPDQTPAWKTTLEILAFLIGCYAVYVYKGQWDESATANRINAANFRRDERSWVGFALQEGKIPFTLNQPFTVPTLLINSGKTPAKNVEGTIVVGVFPRGTPLDFSYQPGHAVYHVASGVLFPGGKIEETFEGMQHGELHAEPIILTRQVFDDIAAKRAMVFIHGRVTYKDIFGTDHWTTYCRSVSDPSLIPLDCTKYNDTDNNE